MTPRSKALPWNALNQWLCHTLALYPLFVARSAIHPLADHLLTLVDLNADLFQRIAIANRYRFILKRLTIDGDAVRGA